jgi:putative oxidoreductase
MLKKLMQTDEDVGMLIVRLTLGLVMFPHGAQKMLGWFGGGGFAGTMQGMTGMGLPAAAVFLVILAEFFGSISLISGFLGRVGAVGSLCVMLGAIFMVHLPNGFFMNWMGNQKGEVPPARDRHRSRHPGQGERQSVDRPLDVGQGEADVPVSLTPAA